MTPPPLCSYLYSPLFLPPTPFLASYFLLHLCTTLMCSTPSAVLQHTSNIILRPLHLCIIPHKLSVLCPTIQATVLCKTPLIPPLPVHILLLQNVISHHCHSQKTLICLQINLPSSSPTSVILIHGCSVIPSYCSSLCLLSHFCALSINPHVSTSPWPSLFVLAITHNA